MVFPTSSRKTTKIEDMQRNNKYSTDLCTHFLIKTKFSLEFLKYNLTANQKMVMTFSSSIPHFMK